MASTDLGREILNSWKEIAQYLHRGTRTVQRWEHDLGLPVRRPRGKNRSAVIALRSELDIWVSNCPQANLLELGNGRASKSGVAVAGPLRESILISRGLRNISRQLRREISVELHSLVSKLREIRETTGQDGPIAGDGPIGALGQAPDQATSSTAF